MQIPRWRNLLLLKNSLPPAFLPSKPTPNAASSFHSTSVTSEKWKTKSNFDERRTEQPTKKFSGSSLWQNYVRYTVHQKRADTKTALKNLLYNSGCSNVSFKDEVPAWKFDGTEGRDSDTSNKKQRSRSSGRHSGKSNHKKVKRKFKKESFSEDFDHPERIFQAKFGNKSYTWSPGGDNSFKNPEYGFEWREKSGWTNQRTKEWETISDTESEEDESYGVGSCSDREALGLPRTGPLKIEDVKTAFRLSALKWHPDKHQGSSQEMAEEKFKVCVDAYKSLCHALS